MPKIRDILLHVSVEPALAKRTCHRSGLPIVKGENCLVIKTGSMNTRRNYKAASAQQILDQAWGKLHALYADLSLDPPKP